MELREPSVGPGDGRGLQVVLFQSAVPGVRAIPRGGFQVSPGNGGKGERGLTAGRGWKEGKGGRGCSG